MTVPLETWDRFAHLAEYPSDGSYAHAIDACLDASAGVGDASGALMRFSEAMKQGGLAVMQERYVEAFDFDPACTLDVGWHLLGDAPERGAFLCCLRDELAGASVDERGELPDHLPALLRLIARQDEAHAGALAELMAPALTVVHQRLNARNNPFGHLIDAIARTLGSLPRREDRA